METHTVYCSACDREVRVVYGTAPTGAVQAGGEVDPTGVCVDYCNSSCTGSMCALFDHPPAEMLRRLRSSGLTAEGAAPEESPC
jgi:hypothetical protein